MAPQRELVDTPRYPAVPALFERFAPSVEVWSGDCDANRQDEKDICKRWAELYNLEFEFIPLEKGLARLSRSDASQQERGRIETSAC